jgi:serine/threonine-protein phosphatase 2A regulatory subunit A
LIAIAEGLNPKTLVKEHVGEQLAASWTDKSWRVKYMLAERFVEVSPGVGGIMWMKEVGIWRRLNTTHTTSQLAKAVGQDIVREDLVQAFVQLLGDAEAEVKTAAAGQIPGKYGPVPGLSTATWLGHLSALGFAELIDRDVILARIIPCVQNLSTDQSQHVRAALSKQVSGLAPLLGKAATEEYLLPIFLRLLKDEFSEVRLHLISELEVVNKGECARRRGGIVHMTRLTDMV